MSTTQTLNGGFQPRLKKPRACVQIALEQQTEIIAFVQQGLWYNCAPAEGKKATNTPCRGKRNSFLRSRSSCEGTRGIAYRLNAATIAGNVSTSLMHIPFFIIQNFFLRRGFGGISKILVGICNYITEMPLQTPAPCHRKEGIEFLQQLRMVKVFVFEQKLKNWLQQFMPQLSAMRGQGNFGLTRLRIPR